MKHLTLSGYGSSLGIADGRLIVRHKEGEHRREIAYPLNRLRTVSIVKGGVSVSSDLILELSVRGVHLFVLDFRGGVASALVGAAQHAVVAVRQAQMHVCAEQNFLYARMVLRGKIKNQRAVLKYFAKYHRHPALEKAAQQMEAMSQRLESSSTNASLADLLGIEGAAASIYFQGLVAAKLLPSSFIRREGRGSQEVGNAMLNLGYAILASRVMSTIFRAGLEPYLGFLHANRPGKPSLVLDIMEEYRAWTVDRVAIKLRHQADGRMDDALKKAMIAGVADTFSRFYTYRGKRLRLEHILQRQVYRLSGSFHGRGEYRPYLFKW